MKLLSTAMGEATSDFLVHRFNPELAVLGAAVVFVAILWWQLTVPRFLITAYWSAVVMVSVFGTMCADVLHVRFGVPYVVSAFAFAVALVVVFVTWSRVEHTLSIHSITTTRRELFYWAAVTVTFALGTAVGDLTAYTAGLGFLRSALLYAILFCLPVVGFALLRLNAVAMFWTAYILTRPLGASFADYLGKSRDQGALNWGPGNVSFMFSAVIVVIVAVLVGRERQRRASRVRRVG
ncbi:MAG TPA: hypothetical protein VNF08_02695 [Acidimicrobiales bacterium]|nr:hypothetical protein [Acidimicrobiales bacterium]